MQWRLLEEEYPDIYRNMALEEALVRVAIKNHRAPNTLRFWRSDRAVVIGRFQCPEREVDIVFCRQNNIPIARRFTGGGTVYHDLGNLNFTFCLNQTEPTIPRTLLELYWNFVGCVVLALQDIGVMASFDSERSTIRLGGKKISGTAGWIKQGVSFVHGTVLVESDLTILNRCLQVPPTQSKYLGSHMRCVDSRRESVTSIREQYADMYSIADIKIAIIKRVERFMGTEIVMGQVSERETEMAEALYNSRYSNPAWNLGPPSQSSVFMDIPELG